MEHPPLPFTMLPLLEGLLNAAAAAAQGEKKFRLAGVRLHPESVVIELELAHLANLVDGAYPLELRIRETSPAETRCEAGWARQGGLTGLLGVGARLMPRALLNEALQRLLGDWIRVEGEYVIIDHGRLIAAATRPA